MDQVTGFLVLAGAVWVIVEMMPRLIPWTARLHKQAVAIVLGPVLGAAAAWSGLVAITASHPIVAGALGGLLATFIAAGAHTTVIKPVTGGKV